MKAKNSLYCRVYARARRVLHTETDIPPRWGRIAMRSYIVGSSGKPASLTVIGRSSLQGLPYGIGCS